MLKLATWASVNWVCADWSTCIGVGLIEEAQSMWDSCRLRTNQIVRDTRMLNLDRQSRSCSGH